MVCRSWRLLGWSLIQVVGIGVDGGADGVAPVVAAEGAAVLLLSELNALHHDLGEIGEGASGFGLDVALGCSGKEAAEGGVEIAGGKITAGEEIGDVAADVLGGLGLRLLAGMEIAELRIAGRAGSAAAAAVGKGEGTQRRRTSCRHGSLLKSWIWIEDWRPEPARMPALPAGAKKKASRRRGALLNNNILPE